MSAFWSIFFIYWIIIANKGEFSDIVWLNNTRLDCSEWCEHILDLSISVVNWNVFDVNVVDNLSLGFLHIFWFEFNHLDLLWLVLKGVSCRLNVLVTYESVTSWSIICIDWCFHTLNFSILLKNFMQFYISNLTLLWKFDEYILRVKLFSVRSKNLHVKWKCSALLSIYFKVSHLFASNFKLGSIFNANDSCVEWFRENISVNLWLSVKGDPCVMLKCFLNFYWSAFVFW